ncbi:uncharacterized protein ARMOST_20368 [Armillaria ostoyae]|uniref:Uncharacterized protein n=1 Tax=Armillaria ostoyae TaxID=47428 RepID=A0A284S767_ARMOS|nr:uncharacterized protein ARMOST_20368 [Armillaria ostoyae]
MILDHKYDKDGNIAYLAQHYDRFQKWVKNPPEGQWKELLDKYWTNQANSQHESPPEET